MDAYKESYLHIAEILCWNQEKCYPKTTYVCLLERIFWLEISVSVFVQFGLDVLVGMLQSCRHQGSILCSIDQSEDAIRVMKLFIEICRVAWVWLSLERCSPCRAIARLGTWLFNTDSVVLYGYISSSCHQPGWVFLLLPNVTEIQNADFVLLLTEKIEEILYILINISCCWELMKSVSF